MSAAVPTGRSPNLGEVWVLAGVGVVSEHPHGLQVLRDVNQRLRVSPWTDGGHFKGVVLKSRRRCEGEAEGAAPVCSRYWMLTASTGKKAAVAPYSGHMLAMVARSAMDS